MWIILYFFREIGKKKLLLQTRYFRVWNTWKRWYQSLLFEIMFQKWYIINPPSILEGQSNLIRKGSKRLQWHTNEVGAKREVFIRHENSQQTPLVDTSGKN